MAYFPTVPEPDRAYLDRASRTESERKTSRAISHVTRGTDDPRVEIGRIIDIETQQRVLFHLGSRKIVVPLVEVADELARAQAPEVTEFRSGLFFLTSAN